MGVSKKLLTPTVIDAVVEKVAQKRITNSKDLRKARTILPDPAARDNFLSEEDDLETASLRVSAPTKREMRGLSGELDAAVEAMKRVPRTTLAELKGDPERGPTLAAPRNSCRQHAPSSASKRWWRRLPAGSSSSSAPCLAW